MKTLGARLEQLGYSLVFDLNSEADGRAIIVSHAGVELGRFNAFEIIGMLTDRLKLELKL